MTAQLSRERLEEKLLEHIKHGGDSEEETMIRMLLAGMSSEPVGEVVLGDYDDCGNYPDAKVVCIAAQGQADWNNFRNGTKLYAAPPAPVSVPDGWKLVPVDPTEEMLASAKEWFGLTATAEGVYQKMIAAAPAAPEQEV